MDATAGATSNPLSDRHLPARGMTVLLHSNGSTNVEDGIAIRNL
jgi:hypothetical protein